MAFKASPLSSPRVSRHQISAHSLIPNTSIQHRPLFIYHSAFPSTATASEIEANLSSVGVLTPQWRYTMYSTTHFHSTTHEVLCISNGRAKLCFGGDDNPGRIETSVEKGDVVVIPAGVGHRLPEDERSGGNFEMVGSYPNGSQWDMCYGKKGDEDKVRKIGELGWFERDPLYGDDGPVLS